MHKRRPAIVVRADSRGVTVVPITSKEPDAERFNRAIFELEQDSTKNIKELDTGRRSFALCELIQTISPTRILPPESRDFKGRDRTYRRNMSYSRRLTRNDEKALEQGLLSAVGMFSLREKLDNLTQKHEDLKTNIDISKTRTQDDFNALSKKYQILSELYLTASEHKALEQVEKEVNEFLELD